MFYEPLLWAVYLLSIGLLIIVIINPIIGVSESEQRIDFPHPISRLAPKYCPIK
jgi:hypothetical protein